MSESQSETVPYSATTTDMGHERKLEIPEEMLKDLLEIERAIVSDPFQTKHPERIRPASQHGVSFIYMHPAPEFEVTYDVFEETRKVCFNHYVLRNFVMPKSIFISYAHEDRDALKKIKAILEEYDGKGEIKYWDDSQLKAGEKWEEQIQDALDEARAGLLLVSPDFLKSKFIKMKELPDLLEGAEENGKKIFWIHLKKSKVFKKHKKITDFQSPMEDPTVALGEMKPKERKKTWKEIKKAIEGALNAS